MTPNVEMKACPKCGTLLLASLVDAINNPSQPESCPRYGEETTESFEGWQKSHYELPFMDYESAQA